MRCPAFGADRDDIVRLRHLASHTSGIAEPPLDTPTPLRDELLGRARLPRGTASRYSTVAFEGIAALIAHATGGCGMPSSRRGRAIGADGSRWTRHPTRIRSSGAAEAGVDVESFARLRTRARVSSGARRTCWRSAPLSCAAATASSAGDPGDDARPLTGDIPRLEPYPAERGQDWGFTWNLRTRAPGLIDRDVYGHGGWSGAEFWIHPSAGLAWVLMTNQAARPGVDADELDNAVISGL